MSEEAVIAVWADYWLGVGESAIALEFEEYLDLVNFVARELEE
jgi:hypothetical protein